MANLIMQKSVINFLEPKGKKYKTLDNINIFLNMNLSVHAVYKWETFGDLTKRYSYDIYDIYTNHRVFVYFPEYNIRIDMPIYKANKISVIKVLLENNFSEETIKFKYYNENVKQVMDGPILVIITLPLDSIILDDNQTLFDKLNN